MPEKSIFFVCGTVTEEENATYWNNDKGWTEDISEATPFDSRVLTLPLPPGGTGIIEYADDKPVRFLGTIDLPPREVSIQL